MLAALLVAFLGLMFFGTGGDGDPFGELMTQHVKSQIKTTITDHDRRKEALKGLSSLNDDVDDMNRQLSKEVKTLEKLIKHYDSKPEDFDLLFTSMLATREKQIDQLWDDRRAMLKHIKANEWQVIIDFARADMEKEAAPKTKK